MAISLKPHELGAELKARALQTGKAVANGIEGASLRSRTHLSAITPVDTGQAAQNWRVGRKAGTHSLYNEAPYVGVLELGARPHPISREGIENIARSFQRKYGLSESEAESAAWGYARRVAERGVEPRYFVRDALPLLHKHVADEVVREIKREAKRRASK